MNYLLRDLFAYLPRLGVLIIALLFIVGCDDNSEKTPQKGQFTVTFNSQGGSTVAAATVEEGGTVVQPANPTKAASVFKGWFTDQATTKAYVFSNSVTAHITLYAKWVNAFTVNFNSRGGSDIAAVTVEEGQSVAEPSKPIKDDSVFKGWFTDEATTPAAAYVFSGPVTTNITLYAKWVEVFTVTFDSQRGSDVAALRVEKGQPVARPAEPTRTNFIFKGWFTDDTTTAANFYNFDGLVNTNITLYAKWAEGFTVNFNSQGGSDVAAVPVEEGQSVAEPAEPTRDRFVFKGWFIDRNTTMAYTFNMAINNNITLYAKWVEIFTVFFDTQRGSAIERVNVEDGQTATQPADPTRERAVFAGWFTDEATTRAYSFSTPVTMTITLYAKWDASFLTVTLRSETNSALSTQELLKSGDLIYEKDPFVIGGQYITGYFTSAEKNILFDFSQALTKDTVLYINAKPIMQPLTKGEFAREVDRAIASEGNTVDLNYIDTKDITNMDSIFFNKRNANPDVSLWNMGKVTSMVSMFQGNSAFNQDISNWDVSKVTNMSNMFNSANSFNRNIGGWNVSAVTNMRFMFSSASQFNQDISTWDVRNVTNMGFMFERAPQFNQDISTWAVDDLDDTGSMFLLASQFSQDLTAWEDHLELVNGKFTGFKRSMFSNSGVNPPPSWY